MNMNATPLPHIKLGDKFVCKKTIHAKDGIYYKKGKVYQCNRESTDPTKVDTKYTGKYMCGFITDEQGNKDHAWPYFPEIHPFCHDRYTDFFSRLT